MRVIDAFDGTAARRSVRAVAVAPDGRFVAAATEKRLRVFDWMTGEAVADWDQPGNPGNPVFTPDGRSVVYNSAGVLHRIDLAAGVEQRVAGDFSTRGRFARGVAVSPDGKTVVATRYGYPGQVPLERWELPAWRPLTGFDFWSPFARLGFSPNGEFIAGINRGAFELRIAVSGGKNGWHQPDPPPVGAGFFAFPRDSQTVVFGWDAEFRVMKTNNGEKQRPVAAPDHIMFADAAFTGTGRHLATVNGTGVMRVWSAESWEVVRGYDWGAGGLTCLATSPDGLAGVCGTDQGTLVVFDVDE